MQPVYHLVLKEQSEYKVTDILEVIKFEQFRVESAITGLTVLNSVALPDKHLTVNLEETIREESFFKDSVESVL